MVFSTAEICNTTGARANSIGGKVFAVRIAVGFFG